MALWGKTANGEISRLFSLLQFISIEFALYTNGVGARYIPPAKQGCCLTARQTYTFLFHPPVAVEQIACLTSDLGYCT
jgi:hypothetical protein